MTLIFLGVYLIQLRSGVDSYGLLNIILYSELSRIAACFVRIERSDVSVPVAVCLTIQRG